MKEGEKATSLAIPSSEYQRPEVVVISQMKN